MRRRTGFRVLMVGDAPEVSSPVALHSIEQDTPGIVVARARSEREARALVTRTRLEVVCVDAPGSVEITRKIKRHRGPPS